MESVLLDAAGHRRSPATMPGYHRGRPPRNKGEEYPADPPTAGSRPKRVSLGRCVRSGRVPDLRERGSEATLLILVLRGRSE